MLDVDGYLENMLENCSFKSRVPSGLDYGRIRKGVKNFGREPPGEMILPKANRPVIESVGQEDRLRRPVSHVPMKPVNGEGKFRATFEVEMKPSHLPVASKFRVNSPGRDTSSKIRYHRLDALSAY
jgi:hypothetical protein